MNATTRRGLADRRPLALAALLATARTRGRSLWYDHGATSVEYAIMVGLIAVVIVAAVTLFGQNMIGLFNVPTSRLNP